MPKFPSVEEIMVVVAGGTAGRFSAVVPGWMGGEIGAHPELDINAVGMMGLSLGGYIAIRMADEKLPPRGIATEVTEFSRDSVVFDEDGVTVSAFRVDHGQYVVPAYGYRVSFGKRSVVISGDTRYCENVIVHARGADLLLHEVAMAADDIRTLPHIRRILDHHTSPADAGRVFAQAKPRLAVFTHLALLAGPGGRRPSVQDVVTETRKTYSGPLEIGEDLMRVVVGETIRVDRFDPVKQGY